MRTGPRGEKRPVSSVSSMVKAMKVATGIEKEEYVDGSDKQPRIDEQVAALRMVEPVQPTKSKKTKSKIYPKD